MVDSAFPQIPGYTLKERVYSGGRTEVYRAAASSGDARDVVIKLLVDEHPTVQQLVNFRNQFTIASRLSSSLIATPLELVPWNRSYALVVEDVDSISLRNWVQMNGRLKPEQVLNVALQLTDCLQHLSLHRIIHKDINPDNILVQPETQRTRLIDFGLASLLPRESQEVQSPDSLEGTIPYIAPEQTGRMNRGVDYRADYYSLGVTLYELLTGELPFRSDDPMELIHCHLAKPPVPPVEISETPKPLSDIVLKLMAKNPEHRYQSTRGLRDDLRNCQSQWSTHGRVESFDLGSTDVCDQFLIPEKLYGRDEEVKQLLAAFDRVAQGASELMLVSGCSGVGKTAVVHEVHKPIVQRRGYFAQGKFDQFNRDIPFSALVEAFRDLVGQLCGESETPFLEWRARILAALGDSGQVLIDVIPELEAVIGPQPAVAELSGNAARNRLHLVFEKFVGVFATSDRPLVIFLDDLQWVDSASLDMLKLLMGNNRGHLLLLGAYRDNEVYAAHPLLSARGEIEQQATVSAIRISPLAAEQVNELVADTLCCSPQLAEPLTDVVYENTKGNPFFTIQCLKGMHEDGLIAFDESCGYWECDLAAVKSAALSEDVLEYMATRLVKLPQETQDALKRAACIGNQFDLKTLATICEARPEEVATALWDAMREGLVLPKNQQYKFFQGWESEQTENATPDGIAVSYRFLHDRVQRAAYGLIAEQQRRSIHWNIGQLLLKNPSTDSTQQLFLLVNQLNQGLQATATNAQRRNLTELNLSAGKKAKSAAAFDAAYDYFENGIKLLPDDSWQQAYELTHQLYFNAAESAYLAGKFERAEQLYRRLLENARSDTDQAAVLRLQMTQYLLQGLKTEAIAIQRQSLKLLGWQVPETDDEIENELQNQVDVVDRFLSEHSIDSILEFPVMADQVCEEMLRILQILFYAAWFDGQTNLSMLALAKMTTLSLRHGNSEMSPFGYVGYGLLLNARLQKTTLAHDFGKTAVQLCDQFENDDVCAMTNFLFAADVHSWSRPIREAETYYENAYKHGMEAGNWLTVSFMMMQSGSDRLTAGMDLNELHRTVQTHVDFLDRAGHHEGRDALIAGVLQPIKNLLGLTRGADTFDDEEFKENAYLAKYATTDFQLAWFYSVKVRHAFLFRLQESYANLIPKLKLIEETVPSHTKVPSTVFYVALMHLSLLENREAAKEAAEEERDWHWNALRELEEKLDRWCENCSANILHKRLLITAERARIEGRHVQAMENYDRAIDAAREQRYIYEEALANELAGKFYLDWGKDKIAGVYLEEALYCYERWGAKAKADDLRARYEVIRHSSSRANGVAALQSIAPMEFSVHSSNSGSENWDLNSALDLTAILKSARALSECIDLEDLLKKLGPMMLQTSGAERMVLLLPDADGNLQVRASLTTDTDTTETDTGESFTGETFTQGAARSVELPMQLVRFAQRTQEVLVIDSLSDSLPMVDSYLQQHPHRSVLFLPVVHQNQFAGLFYFDHRSAAGVFAPDRVTILNFLGIQAAIALKNAMLNQSVERKREESEHRFRSMANNIPGVIYQLHIHVDGGHSFPYVSHNCHELFEVSAESVMRGQRSLREFEHAEDKSVIQDISTEKNRTLQPFDHEFRIVTPSGKVKWAHATSRPRPQSDGSVVWDGVVMDVSQRKRAELDLKVANDELAKATKMKDKFLATMSHELRTPLSAILGMTEGLRDGIFGPVSEEQKETFDVIEQSGSHLLGLINQVLDLSKIESGSVELELSEIQLAGLCDSVTKLLAPQAKKKNIRLTSSVPFYLPSIEADEMRVRQILINLISNAIKFTPEGGEVTLAAKHSEATNLREAMTRISVTDTGIGIDESQLDSIFQPFVQVDTSLSRRYDGAGLGLALVKQFTELHSGEVAVRSDQTGSCFSVELPVRQPAKNTSEPVPSRVDQTHDKVERAAPTNKPASILVAEDNEMLAKTTTRILEASNFRVHLATDGEAAIQSAIDNSPDLILMDVQMPIMDGLEAIRRLRAMPEFAHTPIIALTGLAMQSDAARCLALGADAHLSKPYRMSSLVDLIRRLIESTTMQA